MGFVAKNFMTNQVIDNLASIFIRRNQAKKTHKHKRKTGGRKKQKGGEGNWVKKTDIYEDKCAICWNPLNSKLVYQFVCTHQFHSDCINDYCNAERPEDVMEGKLTCPICRNANTPDVNDCTNVWAYKADGLDPLSDVIVHKSLYVKAEGNRKKKIRHKPRKNFLKKSRKKKIRHNPRKNFLKKSRKKRHRAKSRR